MSLVDLGKRLLESAKLGETEEVRQLMTNGAPFTTDWLGTSPLHMAAQHGHMATAEVLLRAGISRDARTKVDRTPLHVAAQEGHLEIVELLIKHGAEVDAKDMLRMTPLHWAVERGHMSVINCLLRNGADVNSQSKFDKTPFDIAEDNCQRDVVRILQEYASNPVKTKDETSKSKSVQLLQTSAATSPTVKTATPLTVKTDSISVAQIRNVVNRTVTTNNRTAVTSTTSATSTSTSSANKTSSSRPILLQANLAHLQKAAAAAAVAIGGTTKSSSSDSEEGDTSEQSCTNVLATLAALAEATAPNATLSTSEALQWLETHGIAMLPADNSTVVASALEGGQTISLTEAGKLALTWVKEQQNLNNSTTEVSSSVQETVESSDLGSISSSQNQKVITIVADQSQLPSIISSQQQPIVVVSSQAVNNTGVEISADDPPVKKLKTYLGRKDQPKPTANGKVTSTEDSLEEERLKLQKELEKMKKQAEEYKAQLLQKEHEAEQYRRQLEQMRTMPRSNQ